MRRAEKLFVGRDAQTSQCHILIRGVRLITTPMTGNSRPIFNAVTVVVSFRWKLQARGTAIIVPGVCGAFISTTHPVIVPPIAVAAWNLLP